MNNVLAMTVAMCDSVHIAVAVVRVSVAISLMTIISLMSSFLFVVTMIATRSGFQLEPRTASASRSRARRSALAAWAQSSSEARSPPRLWVVQNGV